VIKLPIFLAISIISIFAPPKIFALPCTTINYASLIGFRWLHLIRQNLWHEQGQKLLFQIICKIINIKTKLNKSFKKIFLFLNIFY